MSERKTLVIGIDPGKSTGLAVYSRAERRLVRVETVTFWRAYDFILGHDADSIVVCVEYQTFEGIYKGQEKNETEGKRRDVVASRVGGSRREASLLIERLESLDYDVRRLPPFKAAKWTPADLKRVTGWTGRSSKHSRDASRLCFGF